MENALEPEHKKAHQNSASNVVRTTNDVTNADRTEAQKQYPPTIDTYGRFQFAYNFFNAELFDGRLPHCLITLQRKGFGTLGYFAQDKFENAVGRVTDEIALNPKWFKHRSFADVMSTLVHEMVHLWQRHYGRPSRGTYHNKQWAAEMGRIGLHPSHTGAPGGRETGQQMTHYIVPGGAFDLAHKKLAQMMRGITWFDADGGRPFMPWPRHSDDNVTPIDAPGTRARFTCPTCEDNAWGKPSLQIDCRKCQRAMGRTK